MAFEESGLTDSEKARELHYRYGVITLEEYTIFGNWHLDEKDNNYVERTPENEAIYEKVQDKVEEFDRPQDYTQTEVPDKEDFQPKDPSQEDLPQHLNTTGDEKSDIVVSTTALLAFSGKLEQLEDVVGKNHESIGSVHVKPGAFGAGINISNVIHGNPGLAGETGRFLQSVAETLYNLRTDIRTLIAEYDNTEDWNNLTVNQLNSTFNESFGQIESFAGFGESNREGGANGADEKESEQTSGGDRSEV